jgi:hypothetical protein
MCRAEDARRPLHSGIKTFAAAPTAKSAGVTTALSHADDEALRSYPDTRSFQLSWGGRGALSGQRSSPAQKDVALLQREVGTRGSGDGRRRSHHRVRHPRSSALAGQSCKGAFTDGLGIGVDRAQVEVE